MDMPAFSNAFLVDGTGPIPIISGATPAEAYETIVAKGVIPSFFAISSLITTTAAAESLIPDALPAVTAPSFLNAGFNFPRLSAVTPSLGNSSVSNTIGSPFL